jgi:predicted DNA-binding transcriptional regulator AlpA
MALFPPYRRPAATRTNPDVGLLEAIPHQLHSPAPDDVGDATTTPEGADDSSTADALPRAGLKIEVPRRQPDAGSDNDPDAMTYLSAPQVRCRYGKRSEMWLYRQLANDPTFPRPLFISTRRYWRVAELIAWERTKTTKDT